MFGMFMVYFKACEGQCYESLTDFLLWLIILMYFHNHKFKHMVGCTIWQRLNLEALSYNTFIFGDAWIFPNSFFSNGLGIHFSMFNPFYDFFLIFSFFYLFFLSVIPTQFFIFALLNYELFSLFKPKFIPYYDFYSLPLKHHMKQNVLQVILQRTFQLLHHSSHQ